MSTDQSSKNYFSFLKDSEEITSDLFEILDEDSRAVLRQIIATNLSTDDLRAFLD